MDKEKEQRAIEYLRAFEPKDKPYRLCYSGGKDSDTIRILAELAGVKHEIVHNVTTVDAPETMTYIRSIPNVKLERPELSMYQLIVKKKYPPTRITRYCCTALKERNGQGRLNVTGVRWAESAKRRENGGFVKIIGKPDALKKDADEKQLNYTETKYGGMVLNNDNAESRRFVERCYRTASAMVNPIVDWTDSDVWEFLHYYGCEANPLYQCGAKRIGCIGCPMGRSKQMKAQFARWPRFRAMYVRAFGKMLEARAAAGLGISEQWTSGEAVMRWWVGDNPDQISLFDENEEVDGEP